MTSTCQIGPQATRDTLAVPGDGRHGVHQAASVECMGMLSRQSGLIATLVLLCAALAAAPSGASAASPPTEDPARRILQHLGLDARASLPALDAGKVVHSGLRNSAEPADEVSAVGAMLLVQGVAPAKVVAAFVAPDPFTRAHNVRRRQANDSVADRSAISRDLSVGDAQGAKHLLTQPARYYNLSRDEAAQALQAGQKPGDATAAAGSVMAGILDGRLREFRFQGLKGTPDYMREDGRRVNPGAQLQLAIRQIGLLEAQFPAVLAALRGEAAGSGAADIQRADFWLEEPFVDVQVLSLASGLHHAAADRALAADLHFYASRGYNAMPTVVGVLPYKSGSLVFAITHLFTDEVLGYASSIKRAAARDQVAAQLVRHSAAVRATLPR
jgi:hypothetical protein